MQDTHTYHEPKKYEGFDGRPPVGERPGARAAWAPLKSGPEYMSVARCLLMFHKVLLIRNDLTSVVLTTAATVTAVIFLYSLTVLNVNLGDTLNRFDC